jgi:hypothetical protein
MTPKKSLEEILTPADQTGIPGLIKDSGGRFQHISKIKLILLDFLILLATTGRYIWIIGEIFFVLLCAAFSVKLFTGSNFRNFSFYIPPLSAWAAALTLVPLGIFFAVNAIEDLQREIRLTKSYLKWHRCKWKDEEIIFSKDDDNEPIGKKDPRLEKISTKAIQSFGIFFLITLFLMFRDAGWHLPWLKWGWFQ